MDGLNIAGTCRKKKMAYLLTLFTRKLSQIGFDQEMEKNTSQFYSNFFPKPPSSGLAAGLVGSLPRQMKATIVHRRPGGPVASLGLISLVKWLLFCLLPDRPLQCQWSWVALWPGCCRTRNGVSACANLSCHLLSVFVLPPFFLWECYLSLINTCNIIFNYEKTCST